MKNKTIIFFIIFVMLISGVCFAADSVYVWSNNTNQTVLQTVSDVEEDNSLNSSSLFISSYLLFIHLFSQFYNKHYNIFLIIFFKKSPKI